MGASIWSDLWLMSLQGRLICYLALLAQIIFGWQPLAFSEFSFLEPTHSSLLSPAGSARVTREGGLFLSPLLHTSKALLRDFL